jgi:hypothetical protein
VLVVHFDVRRRSPRSPVWLLLTLVLVAACAQEALTINTIQLGRGLNADKSVANFTTRFKPTDTIYVAVLTENAGSGTLKARWLFGGRVVSEPERRIRTQGPTATEFHLSNNTGFPPGEYKVELFLDGAAIGAKSFRVATDDPKAQYTFPNTVPSPRRP